MLKSVFNEGTTFYFDLDLPIVEESSETALNCNMHTSNLNISQKFFNGVPKLLPKELKDTVTLNE